MGSGRRPSAGWATEPSSRAGLGSLLSVALLLGLLSGCLGETPRQAEKRPDSGAVSAAPGPRGPTQAQLRRGAQRVLDERARAVRRGDLELFLRSVDRRDPAVVARQERYFRNVVQLPWQRFDYDVLDTTWDVATRPRWGRLLLVPQVVQRTRLRGFDTRPVERTVGFVFSYTEAGVRLVSDRGARGRVLFRGSPAPWDLTEVQVRRGPGVLGVFDAAGVADAEQVMAATREGLAQLDEVLPFAWPRSVVVYGISDPAVLASFTDIPGGSIDLLGAMTFPTYAGADRSPLASTRMLLLGSSVAAGQPFLGRIVRHELSHVALGARDDSAPAWLSEGLAEYLGARPVPVADRVIPTAALARSRGPVDAMPGSKAFNGPDQDWHYALSWMACDHIASTAGEATLWRLLDRLSAAERPGRDEGQDTVLREVLGYGSAELARRAAKRIQNLYG